MTEPVKLTKARDREEWERLAEDDGPDLRWGMYEMERSRLQSEARISLLIADIMGGTPHEIAARFIGRAAAIRAEG